MEAKTSIQTSRDDIKATKAFQALSKFEKGILTNKVNYRNIQNGMNVASNRGFDFWVQNYRPNYGVKAIVKELMES